MGDAGRDHDDIAGAQLDRRAALAAEPHADGPGSDAEHLVRGAVIVMVRVDPVAPRRAPAVGGEQRFAVGGRIGAGFERTAVDDQRQRRVVRHVPVIGEQMLFDRCTASFARGHFGISLPCPAGDPERSLTVRRAGLPVSLQSELNSCDERSYRPVVNDD